MEDKEFKSGNMEGEESQRGDESGLSSGAEDVESLKKALSEEKERADNYLSNWQRTQADFSNYKKRVEQEKAENIKFANMNLMRDLLPILDDLERALDNATHASVDEEWLGGVRMIYRNLLSSLENHGLCQLRAEGEEFDPNFHEAICQEEGEEGKVIEELQKGYMLKDRLLRPCKVKVGKGKSEEKASEDENNTEGGQ